MAEWRDVYNKQPSRMLILDLVDFDVSLSSIFKEAILNVVLLSNSLKGSSRIPAFGLALLRQCSTHVILPLQQFTRWNTAEFVTTLSGLDRACKSFLGKNLGRHDRNQVLKEAIEETIFHFRKLKQGEGSANVQNALQLVLMSCQNDQKVVKEIESLLPTLDLSCIQKIQVVGISQESKMSESSSSEMGTETQSQAFCSSDNDSGSSTSSNKNFIMERISLEPDMYSIELFFKTWFHDVSTDKEHLRLTIQAPGSEAFITIKCDMFEEILNPHCVPFNMAMYLSTDLTYHQLITRNQSKVTALKLPIYEMETIALVKCEGLSESLFFGLPFVLMPTRCWKIEWEELELNQQRFSALCSLLTEKGAALLVRRKNHQALAAQKQDIVLEGYFMIFAGKCSLLIKSVGVRELVLPNPPIMAHEQVAIPSEVLLDVKAQLNGITVFESYNPLMMSNNLFIQLKKTYKPPSMRQTPQAVVTPMPSCSKPNPPKPMPTGNRFRFSEPFQNTSNTPGNQVFPEKNVSSASLQNATKLTKLSDLLNSYFRPDT